MVSQYPDTITFATVSESTQDSNGNWVPGSSSTKEVKCRWEENESGRFIKGLDGTQVVYSGIVYMKLLDSAIELGSNVTITGTRNGIAFEAKGQVQNISMGQLNTRLWL